ncbi:MAG TPA: carboxypeptidase-like regulatory domain-containing protein, partial [Pyrinomonadaceae bacterium]|nr:carboxypeptidase-like regulatory domain-containing protein [Pyrinomonadaceae bacterium]
MFLSFKSRLIGSFQIPCLITILLLCANSAFGQAQSNAADLQGTVRDTTGAVVANAAVTARNPATNISRDATSNDEGIYRIVNLPPGEYEVTVEAPNFKKSVLPKVVVTVGQAAELNVTLE